MAKIKICGLTRIEDIDFANQILPDYVGFVFAESKRNVDFYSALNFKQNLDEKIQTVGVFVNAPLDEIEKLCHYNVIDFVQLHGDENENYIEQVKAFDKPVIKAVRVGDALPCCETNADYLLFDKLSSKARGGLGESFDWRLLKDVTKPYFLAGGVNLQNIKRAIEFNPFAIDISSGVEENGVKSFDLMKAVVDSVRSVNNIE